MEFVPGENLFQLLKREKNLPETFVAKLFTGILSGLDYLHKQEPPIIHRDLRPQNIIIQNNLSPKIRNFEMSNYGWRFRNTFYGTNQYVSPEISMRNGHSSKTDIWSLGVMLLECIQGADHSESTSTQFGSMFKEHEKLAVERNNTEYTN